MTIPAGAQRNWCPSCETECNDHPSICTVCGTVLQYPESNERRARQPREPSVHSLLASLEALQQVPVRMTNNMAELERLQARLQNLTERVERAAAVVGNGAVGPEWETVPAALLDPQHAAGATNSSRPTSKEYLQQMTRIHLSEKSSLFYSASITIPVAASSQKNTTLDAIPADFGGLTGKPGDDLSTQDNDNNSIIYDSSSTCLILADPRTGKGGRLSQATLEQIQTACETRNSVILYLERGDNVSFVQKARLAQAAGAKALIVGNNQAEPWPYIMKDSSNKTGSDNDAVHIPVVMVKQSDGQAIVKACCSEQLLQEQNMLRNVSFTMVRMNNHECIICQEPYDQDRSAVRIPACGHVFHEACALVWLQHHNTCPFCRRELPTDDPEYEQERRRTQRTHAGSDGRANTQYEDFYG
jgi:hypothetical protein